MLINRENVETWAKAFHELDVALQRTQEALCLGHFDATKKWIDQARASNWLLEESNISAQIERLLLDGLAEMEAELPQEERTLLTPRQITTWPT